MGVAHNNEVRRLRELLTVMGGFANTTHQGPGPRRSGGGRGLWGTPGIPDMYCQLPERPHLLVSPMSWWFEVKVGKDVLSDAQKGFILREIDTGGSPVLVGGVDEFSRFLAIDKYLTTNPFEQERQLRCLIDERKLFYHPILVTRLVGSITEGAV